MDIIIIENEFITQLDLKLMLEEMGHNICGCASTYNEAIQIIKSNKPDVILLDIGLEGKKNGIDVANNITNKNLSNVIFVTANFDRNTIEKVKKFRALGVIEKPFEKNDFIDKFIELTLVLNKKGIFK